MLTQDQKNHIESVAKAALAKYKLNPIEITYDVTGNAAGMFWPSKNAMAFNAKLAAENWDNFDTTVLHEVAHAIDYASAIGKAKYTTRKHKSGKRDMHGKYFKAIMRELGVIEPSTYHSYKVKTTKQRRWDYPCKSCDTKYRLSTVMHNRVQKGEVRICECGAKIIKDNWTGNECT